MFERFSEGARWVVLTAQEEAQLLGHGHVAPVHLLLAVLREPESVAGRVLRDAGVSLERAHRRITESARREDAEALASIGISLDAIEERVESAFGPHALTRIDGRLRSFSWEAKQCLEGALRTALELRHKYIGPEHVLLAVLRRNGGVRDLLVTFGTSPEALTVRLREELARPA